MTPLFPNYSMGGAQKQLKKIALHLAELGHEITILCTLREDTSQPFRWHERVEIRPIFRFKQPFPEPYATPAYNIAAAIQDMGEYLQKADRYYSNDGGLIFPYVYQDIPTVIAIRSVIFSETLQSAFLFQGDRLVLISEHSKGLYQATVGRFFPELQERITVIHNGFDWAIFKPTSTERIRQLIPVDPNQHAIILYPHRPEEPKGIRQTIDVVDRLVHQYKLSHIRTLVPLWIDEKLSPDVRHFYVRLKHEIEARGLGDNFVFHEWVPDDLMPEYYSLGTVTFCLGNYVETFGNVPFESLGCGTPVILARVGTYRELFPERLVDKVDFGDIETAASIAAQIIHESRRTSSEMMAYLHEYFSLHKMVSTYTDVILNADKMGPLPYQFTSVGNHAVFKLPPWCYQSERGIYHDIRAEYQTDHDLQKLLQIYPDGFTFQEATQHGISTTLVEAWYRDGYLVPQFSFL